LNFDQFAFSPHINAAIQMAGYSQPTPIQQQAIPVVLQGRDVLGLAQTGTGKTAAFVLPILQRLGKSPVCGTRVLILEPTRELAEQVHQSIASLSGGRVARSATIYGGVAKNAQIRNAQRGVEILVACPGRLLDLMSEGQMDLSSVEIVVLDEADRLFDMGFLPDVRRILKALPTKRQTLLFSATMPGDIRDLAAKILKDPAYIQVGTVAPVNTVSHALYPVEETRKSQLLMSMLQQTATGKVLVFTRTKRRARRVSDGLAQNGYRCAALQGDMSQNRRQSAIDGFRGGKYDILIATDIAARGIDVSEISHVINFDMPDTADTYTHRIGRTGRASSTGEAFTFIAGEDEPLVRQIERILGSKIERRYLPGFDVGDPSSPRRSGKSQGSSFRDKTGSAPSRTRTFRSGMSSISDGRRRAQASR
jgi:ATP-dependent RNA helicase RhlE